MLWNFVHSVVFSAWKRLRVWLRSQMAVFTSLGSLMLAEEVARIEADISEVSSKLPFE